MEMKQNDMLEEFFNLPPGKKIFYLICLAISIIWFSGVAMCIFDILLIPNPLRWSLVFVVLVCLVSIALYIGYISDREIR